MAAKSGRKIFTRLRAFGFIAHLWALELFSAKVVNKIDTTKFLHIKSRITTLNLVKIQESHRIIG